MRRYLVGRIHLTCPLFFCVPFFSAENKDQIRDKGSDEGQVGCVGTSGGNSLDVVDIVS